MDFHDVYSKWIPINKRLSDPLLHFRIFSLLKEIMNRYNKIHTFGARIYKQMDEILTVSMQKGQ